MVIMDDLDFSDLATVPVARESVDETATHKCVRCGGSGEWVGRFASNHTGRVPRGKCHACNGRGSFKTSASERFKKRTARKVKVENDKVLNLESFAEENPAQLEWLKANTGWDLAASFLEQVQKKGYLSEKQMHIINSGIARDADRATKRERSAPQTQIDMTDLLHRFELANKAGIKRPKVNTGDLLFSLAPASGKNEGYVYVKGQTNDWDERPYFGKISPEGKFFGVRDLEDETRKRIIEIGSDVVAAAKAHGAQHNNCCFCNRDLTTNESVSNGYGPICAERYGLPWEVTEEFKAAKEALKAANQ